MHKATQDSLKNNWTACKDKRNALVAESHKKFKRAFFINDLEGACAVYRLIVVGCLKSAWWVELSEEWNQ